MSDEKHPYGFTLELDVPEHLREAEDLHGQGMMELAQSAQRTMNVLYADLLNHWRPYTEEEKAQLAAGNRVVNFCYEISQAAEKMLETDPTLATPSVVRWMLEEIDNLRCREPW